MQESQADHLPGASAALRTALFVFPDRNEQQPELPSFLIASSLAWSPPARTEADRAACRFAERGERAVPSQFAQPVLFRAAQIKLKPQRVHDAEDQPRQLPARHQFPAPNHATDNS